MTDSYGQFLLKKSEFQTDEMLQESARNINRRREMYENPILEIEEVTIVPVKEVLDIDIAKARRISEEITEIFAVL